MRVTLTELGLSQQEAGSALFGFDGNLRLNYRLGEL